MKIADGSWRADRARALRGYKSCALFLCCPGSYITRLVG